MGFSQKVADEVLVRCHRHCCLCDVYAGTKIELHHIKQVADGGEDTVDNCIPLCFNCHAEVKAYNPHHPKGRKFTETELRGHRDKCYAKYDISTSPSISIGNSDQSIESWFSKHEKNHISRITWGYRSIDQICTLIPGTIALIAGYTGAGKSIYVQQTMLRNMALSHSVLYFHLKESSDALLNNIIAAESKIKLSSLQRNFLTETDWERISLVLNSISFNHLKLVPFNLQPPLTEQLLSATENSNADIIIVDDFDALGFQDNAEIEKFLYCLKEISARTGTTILIIANIPQKARRMDMHPIQRDLPYDGLYRMSDIVQFLYREDDEFYNWDTPSQIEVIVAKNQGTNSKGIVKLVALSDIPKICEIADSKEH